jgi:hypothetical protein
MQLSPKSYSYNESLESAQLQVAELHARGIDADHAAAVTIDSVFPAPNLKAVQMLIVSTEGDLHYLVELGHRTVAMGGKSACRQFYPWPLFKAVSRHLLGRIRLQMLRGRVRIKA